MTSSRSVLFIFTNILKIWNGKSKFLTVTIAFSFLVYVVIFVVPVRNVFLHPIIEKAWRNMETMDILKIHYNKPKIPDGILSMVSCPVLFKTPVNINDVNTSAISTYDILRDTEMRKRSLEKGHGQFLPALNLSQKIENLYLYKVAAAALDAVGVKHFLVAGSLLGLNRHKGFVPWDDDIDIVVNFQMWELVKQALSCIQGFRLFKGNPIHWSLKFQDREYPFVDIFFYDMNDSYLWAITSYSHNTIFYSIADVFPLVESTFEGVKVPVPVNSLKIAKAIYNYNTCVAYRGHILRNKSLIKDYPEGYLLNDVPCIDLSYMYSFFNLDEF